ncbi:DUF1643 domain-containing protein [Gloeobacter kilaueensis]|uniref:DUF1643 domain-containing protein n=1 Tax=Gloeobacter kilaueensis (strain ATCC BAA-2537 / CCAP 1431/1 / ULC 316 / JS1) TaxID=1183438 RepID=U5QJX0_GLOK1|nr:DUF1643 domain-containing protein [Gloeobacter kilaueensis]AGY59282.1 hypothetical protein GKIL_3036 [Gloeobacter kilaueensis JS1]
MSLLENTEQPYDIVQAALPCIAGGLGCWSEQVIEGGAVFDASGAYRYRLWRRWDQERPLLVFVLLNPSTADAHRDDPTLRRCLAFARTWGYGALEVLNLFAWRSSDPRGLTCTPDPVGPDNDLYLLAACQPQRPVILAWGNWGSLQNRNRSVLNLIAGSRLYCLGRTRSGQPRHPLYLSARLEVEPFDECLEFMKSVESPLANR